MFALRHGTIVLLGLEGLHGRRCRNPAVVCSFLGVLSLVTPSSDTSPSSLKILIPQAISCLESLALTLDVPQRLEQPTGIRSAASCEVEAPAVRIHRSS